MSDSVKTHGDRPTQNTAENGGVIPISSAMLSAGVEALEFWAEASRVTQAGAVFQAMLLAFQASHPANTRKSPQAGSRMPEYPAQPS